MKALLIPVKNLSQAKQRLAPWLSQSDRTTLAEAMLEDFCGVVARTRGMDRIFLVSNYELAIARAEANGWEVIRESQQESESASVDAASKFCAGQGVTSLARVPIDLPLVTPDDIRSIFEAAQPAPSMVIAPSRSGTGTNALVRTPPTLFPSHFGPNSFSKHIAEAKQCSSACVILRNERIELDIDDWEDLQVLAARADLPPAISRWIVRMGIGRAVRAAHASAAAESASPVGAAGEK
ncbi:MAG TPA: 2-phospho-L-lactate guanylyltransferase [Candidatus Acidoferrales bacterium]|nr:2-phospho-L-lactate guanylyltransferase [Candidatus Acidoferrales bacterium]